MTVRRALLALAALAGFATALPAAAQDSCRRYRAELASLDRGAGLQARDSYREAAQLSAYYRSIGCEGGGFFLFDTRPAQCGAIAQRIRALSEARPVEIDVSARRRHLVAAIAQACVTRVEDDAERPARGGKNLVCVRTCDGGFFPLTNVPDGRGGADAMCQALCPGTEAAAYAMPSGDDGLKDAAAVKGGRAYSALPNAFKFRTSYVQGCSCRREGETWAQSLARAEGMLERRKGDLIVTAARAEEMSRPKLSAAALARMKLVPVGGATIASTARPVTPATASLAARQSGTTSEGSRAADLEARAEITGTVPGALPSAKPEAPAQTPAETPRPESPRRIRIIEAPARSPAR